MNKIFFILLIAILSGCATSPVSLSKSVPAPKSQLKAAYYELVNNSPNKGRVIVIRDSGFTGSAMSLPIYVNTKKIANLMPSESVTFYLSEGEHFIGMSLQGLTKNREKDNLQEQVINIEAQQDYFYRLGFIEAGIIVLRRSSQLK